VLTGTRSRQDRDEDFTYDGQGRLLTYTETYPLINNA
jgi:YD repeat-containing protein